jgi:hypothetical protein
MWQNLRNVRSIAEKIGTVVAPVRDGDDYYEEEDGDEEEEGDEDEGDDEDEYAEEEYELEDTEPPQTTPRSPFGIVGFFARAMDNEQERYEKHEEDDDDNGDQQDIAVETENDHHHTAAHVKDQDENQDEDQDEQEEAIVDTFRLQENASLHESPGESLELLPQSNFESSFASKDDLEPRTEIPPELESPHELPKRLGLQRESGSLSPMSPNKKFVSTIAASEPPLVGSSIDAPPESQRHSSDALSSVAKNTYLMNSPISKVEKASTQPPSHDEPLNSSETPVRGDLRTLSAGSSDQGLDSNGSRTERLEKICKELKRQLKHAQEEAERLKQSGDHDQLYRLFQEKEARLLEASNEEHEMEMRRLRQEMDETCRKYQQSMIEERKTFSQEHEQMNSLLQTANARNKELEHENQKAAIALEKARSSQEQQHVRALRKIEDRLAQSMATVDERDERIAQLQRTIKDLESHISTDRDGADEAEQEMEELHQENETLQGQLDEMQNENEALKTRLAVVENGADELVRVKVRKA